ncbi:hypothetical protein PRSY57_1032000 [Plasmodium reichenowi]|uniref:Uncharacterized protein n=1 Tax=Plasmodium reichenowi TaxID=5854 RepID=A0A151LFQ3_PLARE|nr:hypothetical protein PRSY57_1032000 [Plasmodium reichenowi]KYN97784.1 hypothetical protein PRSY57_1032000 [Plasmodium reichenowi]
MKSRNNIHHHKKKNEVNNTLEEYKDIIPDIEIQIENLLKKFHITKYDYKITHFLIDIIQNESLKILKNAKHIKKNIYYNNYNVNDDNINYFNINEEYINNKENNDNIYNVKENAHINHDTLYEEKYIQKEEGKIKDINNNTDMENINEKNSQNKCSSHMLNDLLNNFNEDSVIEKSSHIDVVNNIEDEKVNINDAEKIDNEKIENEKIDAEKIDNEKIDNEQIDAEQIDDKKTDAEQIDDKKINDEQINDEQINDEQINDEQINDEQINNEQINDDNISNKPELSLSDIFNTIECTSNNIQEQENKDELINKDIPPINKTDNKENNYIPKNNHLNCNDNNQKNLQNISNNKNKIRDEVLIIDEESVNLAIKEYVLKTIYRKKNVDFLYEKLEFQQKDNLMVNRNIKYPSGLPPYLPDDCSVNTILPSWDIKYNFNSSKRKIKK